MNIIITGNPVHGFCYHGPFDTPAEAIEWATDELSGLDWWDAPLAHPNESMPEPNWIDRHSVNCSRCGELADERECLPTPNQEGEICPACVKETK